MTQQWGPYNRKPDEKFLEQFRQVCTRPAMYVGDGDYDKVCMFLQGLALGYQDWHGSFFHSWLNDEFRQFLIKKYESQLGPNSGFDRCSWWQIYPKVIESNHSLVSNEQLLRRLLDDVEDFNNILVRMVVETDD